MPISLGLSKRKSQVFVEQSLVAEAGFSDGGVVVAWANELDDSLSCSFGQIGEDNSRIESIGWGKFRENSQ